MPGGNLIVLDNINLLHELFILKKRSLLRKDLKIKGQIGEVRQRDKMFYVTLMRQTNEAESSSCGKKEIVNNVIRAMLPLLTLQNVLEASSDLIY